MRNYAAERSAENAADSYQFVQQHVPLRDWATLCAVGESVCDADSETGPPPERRRTREGTRRLWPRTDF